MTQQIKQLENMEPIKNKAIALFGGTFDPIHKGHIYSADAIATWLNLDSVILLPANIPPHKATPKISSKQRAKMVELVCQKYPLFSCDTRELKREKPSYTVDTLVEIKQEQPETTLFFFIGMDSLLNFTQWHLWQKILTLCHIVVSTRPGFEKNSMSNETQKMLTKHQMTLDEIKVTDCGGVLFAPPCNHDISSTQLRLTLQSNTINEQWLTREVIEYIKENKLYLA